MLRKFIDEFKAFALKGNIFDLAIGVVIGTAFNQIVTSLVTNVIMPAVGLMSGGVDVSQYKYTFHDFTGKEVPILYGQFLQSIINFFIIALSVFVAMKVINSLRDKDEEQKKASPPEPSSEVKLLTEIRDLLKK